jgi:hypothetical protein
MSETVKIVIKHLAPVKVSVQTLAPANIKVQGKIIVGGADSSNIFQTVAGETLSGNRVVYIEDGKAFYYDPFNVALYGKCLGITTGAALENTQVSVQLSGVMNWTAAPLTPGSLYYVGDAGQLTTDPPVGGLTILQRVGYAIAADKLKINFDLNILTI